MGLGLETIFAQYRALVEELDYTTTTYFGSTVSITG